MDRRGVFLEIDEKNDHVVIGLFKWFYNAIVALMLGAVVIGFYAFMAVMVAVILQIVIGFIVGISNPIPFVERF